MMKRLHIRYFNQDFLLDSIPCKISSRLTEYNIDSTWLLKYFPKIGQGEVTFILKEQENLPNESELVEMLQGIKFDDLSLR